MRTPLTDLLGIQYPILLPGMSWISTPPLVAAVSEAGGLGILATGPLTPAQTRAAIAEIRSLTAKPYGIGCTLLMPGARENAEVALEERVPVINFSLGKGEWLIPRCHAYGGTVIATVTTVRHARSAQRSGADALLITGHEAAAHGGEVTSLVLVPTIADAVELPVIAGGGLPMAGACWRLWLGVRRELRWAHAWPRPRRVRCTPPSSRPSLRRVPTTPCIRPISTACRRGI